MTATEKRNRRLTGLCLLGTVFFNFPILTLFNRTGTVLGLPLLCVYLFGMWAVIIVLMMFATRSRKTEMPYDYSD